MFGLTLEKLVLVALVAAVVIGPQRLPEYTRKLAATLRSLRDLLQTARAQTEAELGVPLARTTALDLRQYSPRHLVREALKEPAPAVPTADPDPAERDRLLAEAARVRPGQRYLVTGSAAHPRRLRLDTLPVDDPRRLAAEVAPDVTPDVTPEVAPDVEEARVDAAAC